MRISIISTGDELLAGSIADTNAAWIAARVRELGHRVRRISAVGDDIEEIAAVLRRELAENDILVVGGGLGPTGDDLVFAEEPIDLPAALGRSLAAAGLTIGCAESCTGGLIAHAITGVPGSSTWFRGGIVAYSNDLKTALLGVPADLIAGHGAVSEETVRAMAIGARERLGADLALAASGIAGPDGGSPDKPVGLVHLALAHPGGVEHKRCVFAGLDRGRVKRIAAWTAMRLALRLAAGPAPRGNEGP